MSKTGEAALKWFALARETDLARRKAEAATNETQQLQRRLEEAERECLKCVGANIPVKVVSVPDTSYVVIITHEKRVTLHESEPT